MGKVNVQPSTPSTIDYIKSGVIWASFTQSYYNIDGGGVVSGVFVDYWRDGTLPLVHRLRLQLLDNERGRYGK